MCESCAEQGGTRPAAQKRLRLWEVPANLHCAILGTCLGFADLVKTGRKAGIVPQSGATDYEVHAWFVQRSCEPGRLARMLHKRLDRTYRSAVEACRALRDGADLDAFWSRSLANADIPGPFWALMTHPSTTEDLRARAYGDVHMLSHWMSTANRDASQRLRAAEAERVRLSDRLADTRRRLAEREAEYRRNVERHARETGALSDRLRKAEAGAEALAAAEDRLREFERGDVFRALRRNDAARAAEARDARRARDAQARKCEALEREIARLGREAKEAAARLHESEAERAALENLLRSGVADAADRAEPRAPAIDLCGRRIAYIGGRDGAVRHFRALVEKSNGRFSHHDGGVEDNAVQLDRILGQADAVLCPVDCVSHSACLRAKKFCKRTAKTFVPLRNASLSSLAAGLHLAAGGPDGAPDDQAGAQGR